MKTMNMRIDCLELRTCDESLMITSKNKHTTMEIVCWEKYNTDSFSLNTKEYCYTIGYWIKESEGYSFKFVGNRPLKCGNWDDILVLLNNGQTYLDRYFDSQE